MPTIASLRHEAIKGFATRQQFTDQTFATYRLTQNQPSLFEAKQLPEEVLGHVEHTVWFVRKDTPLEGAGG